jgi:hypothetical protein
MPRALSEAAKTERSIARLLCQFGDCLPQAVAPVLKRPEPVGRTSLHREDSILLQLMP